MSSVFIMNVIMFTFSVILVVCSISLLIFSGIFVKEHIFKEKQYAFIPMFLVCDILLLLFLFIGLIPFFGGVK